MQAARETAMGTSLTESHHSVSTSSPVASRASDTGSPLSAFGTVLRYPRHKTIFTKGDEASFAYGVVAGAVRLSMMTSEGDRSIAEFALPGDFFGINWLGQHTLTAETLDDVTLVCFGWKRLGRLGDENKEVRAELFSILRHNLWATQNHLMTLGRHCALERVATFLVELMDRSKKANKRTLDIPMTREDIADYLGLTIETVCRALTELKLRKIIDIPSRHEIVVRHASALRSAAQPED
jgi:CRP/FNR family nitrogen fixation transcriptional regulator